MDGLSKLQAAQTRAEDSAPTCSSRASDGGRVLSVAQRSFFDADARRPIAAANIIAAMRLHGRVNLLELRMALDRVGGRHAVLRTRPPETRDSATCQWGAEQMLSAFEQRIVSDEDEIQQLAEHERRHHFDASVEPLLRWRLLCRDEDECVLMLTAHPMVCDVTSATLLLEEIALDYGRCRSTTDTAPEVNQYAQYARWQWEQIHTGALKGQYEYWMRQLAGAPEQLQLATRADADGAAVHAVEEFPIVMSGTLTRRLQQFAEAERVTLFVVLMAAWAVLLGRWSGQRDLVVGTRLRDHQRVLRVGPIEQASALRVVFDDDPPLSELLRRISCSVSEASSNSDVPFRQVTDDLRQMGRVLPGQTWLEFEDQSAPERETSGVKFSRLALRAALALPAAGTSDLSMYIVLAEQRLIGTLALRSARYERPMIERMLDSWRELLEGMAEGLPHAVSRLRILTASERTYLLNELNRTDRELPAHVLIHQLFEEQAARTPRATALRWEQETLDYGSLNERANRLARYLMQRGIGPGQLVALCMERGVELVIGMLAVLKAGGAYVPLDPEYPQERVQYMLRDAQPSLLLAQRLQVERLSIAALRICCIEDACASSGVYDASNVDPDEVRVTSRDLAFVIYTSGSTGYPKGAMNEHRGMVNRILSVPFIEAFEPDDICCQKTSVSFVDSVFETFGALCHGRQLVIARGAAARDSAELAALVERAHVTQLITVPSLARAMLESPQIIRQLAGLRVWTLSGEAIAPDLLARLQNRLPACDFIGLYGASEVSSDAAFFRTRSFEGTRVPLGWPLPNVRIHVLDTHGELVPRDVAGEICVAGVGVGRGYLNQPDLTASRFGPDPFNTEPHARLYHTGDLGRWRTDGTLEYLGRADALVKVRGFRIEPGEIEVQLLKHATVREAVVVMRELRPLDDRQLVAYVAVRGSLRPSAAELRTYLSLCLPDFMVPAAFVVLPDLPRTPNGKIDRRALPVPDADAFAAAPYEMPQNETEGVLARVWQEILHLERVGRLDNFFEIGGHSLLAAQMLERLRSMHLNGSFRDVYSHPRLSDFARVLERAGPDSSPLENGVAPNCDHITPQMLPLVQLSTDEIARLVRAVPEGESNIQDIYPLAPLQEGVFFHYLLHPERPDPYFLETSIELSCRERAEDLIGALQEIVDRHDSLRTLILWEQLDRPVQVVCRRATLPIQIHAPVQGAHGVVQFQQKLRARWARVDLRQAPLMRLHLMPRRDCATWHAVLQVHHLACDHESLRLLFAEVQELCRGRGSQLPRPLPYRVHVAEALAYAQQPDAQSFFRRKLGTFTEPAVPFGLTDIYRDGQSIEEVREALPARLCRQIRDRARRMGMSPAIVFHAAWALVVSRTSAKDDIVYGCVLLGRLQSRVAAGQLLGMLINTLPLRVQLGKLSARQLLAHTQAELVDLVGHEQASLQLARGSSGIEGGAPLFSTLLNYLHAAPSQFSGEGRASRDIQVLGTRSISNYPIALSIEDDGEGFVLEMQADLRLDPRRLLSYTSTALQSLVEALERSPHQPALQLSVMPAEEYEQVTRAFNDARHADSCEMLLHQTFDAQARRTPQATALVCEGRALTYQELNRRANRLAGRLSRCGVGPDRLVAVCAERGIELVVGLLAVLKAGGAYVPLDPSLPDERLAHMVSDVTPAAILIQNHLRGRVRAEDAELITLESVTEVAICEADDTLAEAPDLRPAHLAYVIYTSGSTGVPKGAMISHRNVVHLMRWHCRAFNVTEGKRCTCLAAVGFDATAWEIWPTLCAGATLILAPSRLSGDAVALLSWWEQQTLDVSFLPTPMAELAFRGGVRNAHLSTLLVGGDRLRTRGQLSSATLVNNYGPTEATVVTTSGTIAHDALTLHIGRPLPNARVYILDSHLRPVPIGVTGELYIGGDGIGRGYLNQAALTAERFIANPFEDTPGARLYKTGDLVRWCPGGEIEYVGRADHQVKIRGYRIELGEIEAQLARNEMVREAVVLALEESPTEQHLVAYVIPQDVHVEAEELEHGLREQLGRVLPVYMVPSAFVIVTHWPLTANGKLDRRALPHPAEPGRRAGRGAAPQGATEENLARIWCELLRLEQIGRDDNFFELGGHSLLATQVMARVRAQLLVDRPVSVLFAHPTLRALAAHLRERWLLESISKGGRDAQQLLEEIASMPESRVQELMQQLSKEA